MNMIEDDLGNQLLRRGNKVLLKLSSENTYRDIGTIVPQDKQLVVYRVYARHLFRKGNSFGFNYSLLDSATTFDTVVLKTDRKEEFHIPIEVIKDKGNFCFFKQQGFEKQIFLSLEELNKYKK